MRLAFSACVSLLIVSLLLTTCSGEPPDRSYHYPEVAPVCFVEEDPARTIFARLPLASPIETGDILVFPLYEQFPVGETVLQYATAHPFVYRPGQEIERKLAELGQRANLARLIVWVPGYFPTSVPRIFRIETSLNDRKVTLIELQRCTGDEWQNLVAATRALVTEAAFEVREPQPRPRPPYSTVTVATTQPYDMKWLVRGAEFTGRYVRNGAASPYGVWGIGTGSRVAIVLTDEDRRLVERFLEKAEPRPRSEFP